MAVCERCGKDHEGTFGSGRFCSRSCANSGHNVDHSVKKAAICSACGTPIQIVINASKKNVSVQWL